MRMTSILLTCWACILFSAARIQGCSALVVLTAGEPVRCNMCGSRILWKLRTKKVVQYEAR